MVGPVFTKTVTSRRAEGDERGKNRADPNGPFYVDLDEVRDMRAKEKKDWLALALNAAKEGRVKPSLTALFDVVAHRKFAEDLNSEQGRTFRKQILRFADFFSSKQQKFLRSKQWPMERYADSEGGDKKSRKEKDQDDDRGEGSRRRRRDEEGSRSRTRRSQSRKRRSPSRKRQPSRSTSLKRKVRSASRSLSLPAVKKQKIESDASRGPRGKAVAEAQAEEEARRAAFKLEKRPKTSPWALLAGMSRQMQLPQ